MLSLKNFLLAVTVATGCVVRGVPVEKRAGPGVYVTADVNWAGSHLYIANVVKGQCYTFAASWQNVVSSFGPDQGLKCYGYQQANCQPPTPNYGPFYYPGISTHSTWDQDGINYDNRVNSFKCWDGTPPPVTTATPTSTRLTVTPTPTSTRLTLTPTSTRQSVTTVTISTTFTRIPTSSVQTATFTTPQRPTVTSSSSGPDLTIPNSPVPTITVGGPTTIKSLGPIFGGN